MKTIEDRSIRSAAMAVTLSIGLGFVTHASAYVPPPSYLIDLKTKTATYLGNNVFAPVINDAGQVAGFSYTAYGRGHAFITGANGVGMRELSTLSGSWSHAYGINNTGQVAGNSYTADGNGHAFITGANGVGMTDLGTLGGYSSSARGINNAGQVVGSSDMVDGSYGPIHAFITGPDGVGMTDLNSLVPLPNGDVMSAAYAINNMGQVLVVTGIPEPETYALMLAGLVLTGVMVRRKQKADALEGVLSL